MGWGTLRRPDPIGRKQLPPAPTRIQFYISPAQQTIQFFKTKTKHRFRDANTQFLNVGN